MTDDRMDEIIRDAARDYNRPPAGGAPREEIWARVQRARQAPRAASAPTTTAPRREWIWRGVGIAAVLAIGIAIGQYVERSHTARSTSPETARQIASSTPDTARNPDSLASRSASPETSVASPVEGTRSPQLAVGPAPAAVRSTRERSNQEPIAGRGLSPSTSGPQTSDGLALRLALVKHLAGTEAMLTSFRTSAKSGDVDSQILVWARDLLRTTRLLQTSAASANDPALRRLLDDLELVLLQISQYTAKASDHAQELELIERSIEKRGVIAKLRTTTPAAFPAGT